jgi:hypothetical protein
MKMVPVAISSMTAAHDFAIHLFLSQARHFRSEARATRKLCSTCIWITHLLPFGTAEYASCWSAEDFSGGGSLGVKETLFLVSIVLITVVPPEHFTFMARSVSHKAVASIEDCRLCSPVAYVIATAVEA